MKFFGDLFLGFDCAKQILPCSVGAVKACQSLNVPLDTGLAAKVFEANKTMSQLSHESCIPFVLISTDYVFDGTKAPYSEEDEKNPLNEYGYHKLKAENCIKENTSKYIIARKTNVFGWDPITRTPN